ncbi:MAG TPA: DMT family transporter [Bacteroidota bacterium]|nr:DMT family transporter [Bacteroidota bacterium]
MNVQTRAELALLSITVIWGSTFTITKVLLEGIEPFLYVALRFTLASLLFALVFRKKLTVSEVLSSRRGWILGLLLFLGFSLQTLGLQFTTASKSAFITGLMVIMTPILQVIIERRPPKLGNVIGIVLVTIGLYLLTSPEGSEFNIGDLLTLGCAISFALYIVYLDIFSKGVRPEGITLTQFLFCGVVGSITALAIEPLNLQLTDGIVLAILYLTIFATIVAIYVQTRFQKHTTPTRAAVIFAAEPVFAAIIAYFALNEVIGTVGLLGGGLIVAGVLVSELS